MLVFMCIYNVFQCKDENLIFSVCMHVCYCANDFNLNVCCMVSIYIFTISNECLLYIFRNVCKFYLAMLYLVFRFGLYVCIFATFWSKSLIVYDNVWCLLFVDFYYLFVFVDCDLYICLECESLCVYNICFCNDQNLTQNSCVFAIICL